MENSKGTLWKSLTPPLVATTANISLQMPVYGNAATVHMLICMFTALMDQIVAP